MKYNYNYKNNQGQYAPYVLVVGDKKYINPTQELYAEAGYLPYTQPEISEEELATKQKLEEIDDLITNLYKTDYKAIKFAEGWISAEDYAEIKAERQAWRDRINELQEELNIEVDEL